MSNTISGSSAPLTGWMFLPKQNEHGNKPPEPVGQLIDGTGKSKKFDRTDFNGYNLNSRPENEFSVNWRKEQEENPTPPKEPNDHIVDNANGKLTIVWGVAGKDNFEGDLSFLVDLAKEYATIRDDQEFLAKPTNIGRINFLNSIHDYIYDSGVEKGDASASEQVDAIVKELAQQIRETGTTDFSKLKNGFEFEGEKISLDDLSKVLKGADALSKKIHEKTYVMHAGGAPLTGHTEQAIIKSVSDTFFGSFSSGIADKIGKRFSDTIDDTFSKISDLTAEYIDENPKDGVTAIIKDMYGQSFEKFSNLDTSSKEALQKSFDKNLEWFSKLVLSDKNTAKELTKRFDFLMNQCFG